MRVGLCLALVCWAISPLAGCKEAEAPDREPPVDAPTESDAAGSATVGAGGDAGVAKPTAAAPSDPHAGVTPGPHAGGTPGAASGAAPVRPTGAEDPHAATGGGGDAVEQPTETRLAGITLTIPEGWVYEVPEVNPRMPGMAPKAIFRLPAVEGDDADVYVRVTHFPGMKQIPDERNLERWYGMLQQPDGSSTRDASSVETIRAGGVEIVLADIPGTIRVAGADKPNQRMLAAIIKHSQGPHFLKVAGPTRSVEHWKDSVIAYVKSARIDQ